MEDNEMLEQDMAEAALLDKQRIGKRRGRRVGSKNANTKRAETAARVALHRQRKKEKLDAESESAERTEIILRDLRQKGFTLFGELEAIGPDGYPVNASTADEELMLAKEYAAALGLPDIRPGQAILNFVTNTLREWCSAGVRMFNRRTGQFSSDQFEGLKPEHYNFPDGCDPRQPYETNQETTT